MSGTWPQRLLKVALGLGVGLGLAEAGVRAWAMEPGVLAYASTLGGQDLMLFRPDPRMSRLPRPGLDVQLVSPDSVVRVRFNSLGLRGGALEPATTPRWLAIGDSFTLAVQVEEEDTFVAQLGPALGVEVLNAGMNAYETWRSVTRYQDLDDAVGASAVILSFFLGNDLTDNPRRGVVPTLEELGGHGGPPGPGRGPGRKPPREPGSGAGATGGIGASPAIEAAAGRRAGADGLGAGSPGERAGAPQQRRAGAGGPPSGLLALLTRHSAVVAWVQVAYTRARVSRTGEPDLAKLTAEISLFSEAGAEGLAQLLPSTRAALTHLRDVAAARGDRVLVALIPPSYTMSAEQLQKRLESFGMTGPAAEAPARAVLGVLAELGVEACDLGPALREAHAAGRQPYLKFDGHFSAEGHRVVATALAGCARASGLTP